MIETRLARSHRTPLGPPDALLLLAACLLVLVHAAWFDHTADDAFITFRYVDNWIHGRGLVFNSGERVMGYSNFLWVVLLAPFGVAGIPIPTAARLLGAALACATLIHVYRFVRDEYPGRLPAIAALLALVSNGGFALWIFGGLEGHLVTFLLALAVTRALRIEASTPRRRFAELGVILGLASLTRPEAIAYVAPTAAWLLWRRRDAARCMDVALLCGVAFCFWLGLAAWAWSYYGDALPNTYYAKAHPLSVALFERGLRMTRKFFSDFLWAPAVVVAVWVLAVRGSLRARGWLPLAVTATFLAFFLRIGGDVLVYHRMWLPVLPMLALLLAEAVARMPRPPARVGLVVLVAALSLPNSFAGPNLRYLRADDAFLADVQLIAARLRAMPEGTVVAANNVGILGYGSGLRVLDMLGLTDSHIARAPDKRIGIAAHESHDGAYVIAARPDLIVLGMPRAVVTPNPERDHAASGYPSDRDLIESPTFHSDYAPRYLELADRRLFPVFARRDSDVVEVTRGTRADAADAMRASIPSTVVAGID